MYRTTYLVGVADILFAIAASVYTYVYWKCHLRIWSRYGGVLFPSRNDSVHWHATELLAGYR